MVFHSCAKGQASCDSGHTVHEPVPAQVRGHLERLDVILEPLMKAGNLRLTASENAGRRNSGQMGD